MPAPKYRRVADAIRVQITSGLLKREDRLPTTEELKRLYGVSYVTLRTALMELERDGLIEGRQGDGRYVVYDSTG